MYANAVMHMCANARMHTRTLAHALMRMHVCTYTHLHVAAGEPCATLGMVLHIPHILLSLLLIPTAPLIAGGPDAGPDSHLPAELFHRVLYIRRALGYVVRTRSDSSVKAGSLSVQRG